MRDRENEITELMKEFMEIYNMLEDEESKDIYLCRLNFLISKDYRYIRKMIDRYVPNLAALNNKAIPDLLATLPSNVPIILYGAGEDAKANLCFFKNDSRFAGFCDRDIDKQRDGFEGYDVISPDELIGKADVSIVISTHRNLLEIRNFLLENGVPSNRIFEMTPYMFCVDPGQYFNPDFMRFEEEEVFVDAGCKDLGTAKELKRYCKRIRKIYAFEPDKANYKDCMNNLRWFESEEVDVINAGTWSSKKTLSFNATADGSSHVTDGGETSIDVVPIDEVVDSELKVTFIKMDVEGSELESLKGAKKTIQKDKPKLAICIYHKAEDMITLPLYIKELVPEYKLYLRHHSNGAGETVLYAMP